MEAGAVAWVDWNMVLDTEGGPTYIENFNDSPVIVNATAGEFYKQPMFYGLGHFTRFVIPDSVRVKADSSVSGVRSLAFERPDGAIAVILYNR